MRTVRCSEYDSGLVFIQKGILVNHLFFLFCVGFNGIFGGHNSGISNLGCSISASLVPRPRGRRPGNEATYLHGDHAMGTRG